MQFKKDHGLGNANSNIFQVMPNYPPQSWSLYQTDFGSKKKTRLVFVGSLGYDNMYLQETIDWVLFNKEFLTLDIYAYNIDQKAKDLLESIEDDSIKYYGGISYESLPATLKNYDVGLVIYKPFSYNTVIAVSNKVFEYLACGLDVWFSEDMSYTLPYIRDKSFPKIIALDFKKIRDFNFKKVLNRDGLKKADNNFFCENVYDTICQSMFPHSFF
jgi:hypothetical protein